MITSNFMEILFKKKHLKDRSNLIYLSITTSILNFCIVASRSLLEKLVNSMRSIVKFLRI